MSAIIEFQNIVVYYPKSYFKNIEKCEFYFNKTLKNAY